jgi:hypothetical protein
MITMYSTVIYEYGIMLAKIWFSVTAGATRP